MVTNRGAAKEVRCISITEYSYQKVISLTLQLFLLLSGHYCETEGLSEPTGLTSAGYWAITRAIQAGPFDDTYSSDFSICPAGFYCPEGSGNPMPCPPGTFR